MDKFEQKKKMKKIRPAKNTWYDWLSNFIPEPLTISVGGFKDKNVCLKQTIHLNKPFMGEERNQKHKTLEIILYLKRLKIE